LTDASVNQFYRRAVDITFTTLSNPLLAATSVATSVAATLAATPTSSPSDGSPDGDENGDCRLMGPFSIVIQGALGALALLSLVYKRWRERPQRPVKIWAFDVSKQVFGSLLLHLVNLLISMVSSGSLTVKPGEYQANPCSFYLLNLAIDTTIGIPILIVLLRVFTIIAGRTRLGQPPESIRSGNYGDPPNVKWWLKQMLIYFVGLLGMKFCVVVFFKICPWIVEVGDWALGWTEGNDVLQIFFVMLLFPVIMNALQYYIVDSFIKMKEDPTHEAVPTEDPDDDSRRGTETEPLAAGREPSFDDTAEDEDKRGVLKVSEELSSRSGSSVRLKTYEAEGEDQALASGTSSRQ